MKALIEARLSGQGGFHIKQATIATDEIRFLAALSSPQKDRSNCSLFSCSPIVIAHCLMECKQAFPQKTLLLIY